MLEDGDTYGDLSEALFQATDERGEKGEKDEKAVRLLQASLRRAGELQSIHHLVQYGAIQSWKMMKGGCLKTLRDIG